MELFAIISKEIIGHSSHGHKMSETGATVIRRNLSLLIFHSTVCPAVPMSCDHVVLTPRSYITFRLFCKIKYN